MNYERKKLTYYRFTLLTIFYCLGFTSLSAQCINSLVVEAHPCDPNNLFLVDLDFEFTADVSDSFSIVGNGNNYGNFAYSDLYITLGPLEGNGMVYEFIINDLEFPDCGIFGGIEAPNCTPADCEIFDLVAQPGNCNSDGTYFLWIDFEVENPGNDFFDLYDGNGDQIGFYNLADLPLGIDFEPSGNNNDVISVCINDNPDCCAIAEFEAPECPPNTCEIWDFVAEAYDCDADGNFLVDIDFNFANTSDSFSVVGNGNNYGNFAYSDLYITLGPLEGNGMVYEFIINDLELPDCGIVGEIEAPNCAPADCEIFDLVAQPGNCNSDGTYFLWIDFEVENPGNDFFDLYNGNGDQIGFYNLADLPLGIDFEPSGNNNDVISVCINDNPDCCAIAEFEAPECPPNTCEIWDFVIEAYDCDADGNFLVDIDFNFANTSDSFSVVGNGNNYGNFAYSDLYITLGPLEGNGMVYEFIINDLEFPDCGIVGEIEAENCMPNDCLISELEVETGDCNSDGTYNISINFAVENPGNDFFDVYDANGDFIGLYSLADLPIEIEYGPTSGNFDAVTVCVNDTPDCCATLEFEAPDCNSTNCEIWDLIVEAYDCDADGNFLVDIDFNYANTSDSFFVVGNGNSYGIFAYSDLYITIGPFEGDGVTNYNFVIMDQEQVDCVAAFNLGTIDCNPNTDCSISELEVYPLDCNPDGTYNLILLFDYENVNTDGFDVYSGNTFVGYYDYTMNFPITVNSFPASGNAFDVITVCDSGGEVCCGTLEFEAPSCEDCEIFDMVVEPFPCNNDNQFFVELDFENVGGGSLGFLVFGNGTTYGNFDYIDLPIILGPFDGDATTVYEFIVVDNVDSDCIGFAEVGPIDCSVPPPVWPGDGNFDNIANNIDLLNLGLAFGFSGEPRPDTGIDWLPWAAEEWPLEFEDGTNFKHADCNGDGVVDLQDIQAIDLNYNETHGPVAPFEETPNTPDDPPLYVELPLASDITIGDPFVAPIILGTLETPVDEIYGIAFTIEFDPVMMDEAGVYVETNTSWLGEPGSELISIDKNFPNDGKIDIAITRTNQTNVAGFGQISYFIGIIDDVAGKSELEINIVNVRAITAEELWVPVHAPVSIIDFTTDVTKVTEGAIEVFPNPASDAFYVRNLSSETIESITIYNVLGQLVLTKKLPSSYEQVDVSNWASGVYFMELRINGQPIIKQIEVIDR